MPTSLSPSWATDEPHELLMLERMTNAGVNLGSVAYGVHLAVFFTCSYFLFQAKRFSWFYQTYITILLALATIDIACNIRFNELTWIDERNFPGGPSAFLLEQQSLPVVIVGNAVTNVITFMVDTLLVYRCYIVWGCNWYVIVLPCLGLVASVVMSILTTIAAAQPGSSIFFASRFGLPYCSLSMALHLLVTATISTRLLLARKKIRAIMGSKSGREYTGIVAMLIESAFPYAVIGIILIAFYAAQDVAGMLFFPVLPHLQCVVSELIILRVHRGRAWSKHTMTSNGNTAMSAIRFDSHPVSSGQDMKTPSYGKHELPTFAVSSNRFLDSDSVV